MGKYSSNSAICKISVVELYFTWFYYFYGLCYYMACNVAFSTNMYKQFVNSSTEFSCTSLRRRCIIRNLHNMNMNIYCRGTRMNKMHVLHLFLTLESALKAACS